MKKVPYILVAILLFLLFVNFTSADVKKAIVYCPDNNDPLNVRDGVGGKLLTALSCNTEVKVLDQNAGSNSSCSKWYKIEYGSGSVGYACGDYLRVIEEVKLTGSDNIYIKENYDNPLSSDGFMACYEDTTDVSLRKSPGGASTGNKVSCGEKVKINSVSEGSGTCGYYYNITDSKGNSGYVCGYYVNTTKLSTTATNYYNNNESLEDYYSTLRSKGFPDSYLPYLAEIHARHPNWVFNAETINLDFNDIVLNENAYGRSLLQGVSFSQNYYSMDINTYDILNDTFRYYPTEIGWYDASSEAVAYYLDPRTYLNEKYIFAFESLNFNSSHTKEIIEKILSSQTFWPTVYKNFEGSVYEDIITATKEVDISSIHIASRIKQEITGISTTDPRLGGEFTYNNQTYSNYYNFFNIKVYGDNKIVNGMIYAMENDWSTPFKAIYGGANFISEEYVKVNQDTMYYQKFDVSTSNGHYDHQYMQNLAAAIQETNTTYNTYVNNLNDYLDTAIVFTIPVYQNMSAYAVVSPSIGNPNNYLKEIKINDKVINNFAYDEYSYEITVPYNTTSINIGATPINNKATIKGSGVVPITNEETTITLSVTSESGRTRNYVINVLRDKNEEENTVEIEYILNNIGIKYNDNYIYGISENTDIKSLIENVSKVNNYASATVKDKDNNIKTSGTFKTGDKVIINNSKDEEQFTILIYGDINGDGAINKDDCLAILRHLNGYTTLTNVYGVSADANKDGKIDKDDCLAILRHLNGYTDLNK